MSALIETLQPALLLEPCCNRKFISIFWPIRTGHSRALWYKYISSNSHLIGREPKRSKPTWIVGLEHTIYTYSPPKHDEFRFRFCWFWFHSIVFPWIFNFINLKWFVIVFFNDQLFVNIIYFYAICLYLLINSANLLLDITVELRNQRCLRVPPCGQQ